MYVIVNLGSLQIVVGMDSERYPCYVRKDLLWWLCYVPVGFSLDWVHWLVYGVICKSSEVSFKTSVLGSWYLMECAKDELITWRDENDFENNTSSFFLVVLVILPSPTLCSRTNMIFSGGWCNYPLSRFRNFNQHYYINLLSRFCK